MDMPSIEGLSSILRPLYYVTMNVHLFVHFVLTISNLK